MQTKSASRIAAACATTALTIFLSGPAVAQVNTQTLDRGEYDEGWMTSIAGDLSLTDGNVQLTEVYGSASVRWQTFHPVRDEDVLPWLKQRWRLDASTGFGSEAREAFMNEQYGHMRWTAMWHRHFGSELYVQGQRNLFQLLDSRLLAGAGVRADAFHTPALSLWAGTGAFSEHERLDADGDEARQDTVRWSSYLVFRAQIGGRENPDLAVVVQNSVFVQPSFEDLSDFRIMNEVQLDLPITEIVSLTTGFNFRRDTNPPPGVQRHDLRLSQGVSVEF
jgi:hypothetical protein